MSGGPRSHVLPRLAGRRIGVSICQPAVQFLAVAFGNLHLIDGETIPDLADELEAILLRKSVNSKLMKHRGHGDYLLHLQKFKGLGDVEAVLFLKQNLSVFSDQKNLARAGPGAVPVVQVVGFGGI